VLFCSTFGAFPSFCFLSLWSPQVENDTSPPPILQTRYFRRRATHFRLFPFHGGSGSPNRYVLPRFCTAPALNTLMEALLFCGIWPLTGSKLDRRFFFYPPTVSVDAHPPLLRSRDQVVLITCCSVFMFLRVLRPLTPSDLTFPSHSLPPLSLWIVSFPPSCITEGYTRSCPSLIGMEGGMLTVFFVSLFSIVKQVCEQLPRRRCLVPPHESAPNSGDQQSVLQFLNCRPFSQSVRLAAFARNHLEANYAGSGVHTLSVDRPPDRSPLSVPSFTRFFAP